MAKPKYKVGTEVFVPSSELGIDDAEYAVLRRKVNANIRKSVRVDTQGGDHVEVASSRVFSRVGVALLRIGDYTSERSFLDPLFSSLAGYFEILVGEEALGLQLRTLTELEAVWKQNHATKRFLVLIGHGSSTTMTFGQSSVTALEVGKILEAEGTEVSVISVACNTGRAGFAKPLSKIKCVKEFVGPHNAAPGAVASQFIQTYFAERLLLGRTEKSCFQLARKHAPGGSNFRRWVNGELNQ